MPLCEQARQYRGVPVLSAPTLFRDRASHLRDGTTDPCARNLASGEGLADCHQGRPFTPTPSSWGSLAGRWRNHNPKPLTRHATATEIIGTVHRGQAALRRLSSTTEHEEYAHAANQQH